MPHADIDEDGTPRIRVVTRFVDKDRMREVPGAAWSAKHEAWKMPLSWAACVTLRGVFGEELTVGEKLTEWANNEYATRVLPAESMRELVSFSEMTRPLPPLPAEANVVLGWATRGRT